MQILSTVTFFLFFTLTCYYASSSCNSTTVTSVQSVYMVHIACQALPEVASCFFFCSLKLFKIRVLRIVGNVDNNDLT